MIDALRQLIGMDARSYPLRVPREEEAEGLLLLGDPGTGKTQVIQQFLAQIALRNPPEAVVCYDPAGEFITNYFKPGQDIVLNPLDARCPYWSPTPKLITRTQMPERPIGTSLPKVSFQIETTAHQTHSSSSSQPAASLRGCWNSNPMPRGLLKCSQTRNSSMKS